MPAILSSSPTMTMQPMPCCASSFAISSNDLSLVVVKTPLPFSFRIVATFISVLHRLATSARDLIDNVAAYLFEAEFVSAGLARVVHPYPAISIYASARPDVLASTLGTL